MAFVLTAQGALIKIVGHTYVTEESASSLNAKLAANNFVQLYDEREETAKINAVYTDYTVDGVTGTTLGSAEAVADAIGSLIASALRGSSTASIVSIADPSITGAELTPIAANASSVQLVAATSTNSETFIRNDGTGVLFVTEGATATANSAIRLEQNGVVKITSGLVVNGIWTSPNGFARINQKLKV